MCEPCHISRLLEILAPLEPAERDRVLAAICAYFGHEWITE